MVDRSISFSGSQTTTFNLATYTPDYKKLVLYSNLFPCVRAVHIEPPYHYSPYNAGWTYEYDAVTGNLTVSETGMASTWNPIVQTVFYVPDYITINN